MSFLISHNTKPSESQIDIRQHGQLDEEDERFGDEKPPDSKTLPASSSSVIQFYPEWCTCFANTELQYPEGNEKTCKGLVRYLFQCPPIGPIARITLFLLIFALIWVVLYLLIGGVAGLSGPILAIIILEILGLFTGMTMKLFGMPTLLAPLIIGIILRNVDPLNIFEFFKYPYNIKDYCESVVYNDAYREFHWNDSNIDNMDPFITQCCNDFGNRASGSWIGPIREIALTLILTRAGTELSPKQLRKLKGVVPALAFIPCICEAFTCASLFYACFSNLDPPFFMCLVAGFALAAVSPAVVVPGLLSLARKGYGVLQGVPTLLIAASSIDDVLAISLYTISLSFAIQTEVSDNDGTKTGCFDHPFMKLNRNKPKNIPDWLAIAGGPMGIVVGIIYGLVVGCILHFLPSRDTKKAKGYLRLIVLLSCNLTCMLGFAKTDFLAGAGSLGVLTTSFVASFGWRSQHHWKPPMHQVENKLTQLWTLFVPILFGTIGNEMRFTNDGKDLFLSPTDREAIAEQGEHEPFDAVNIVRIIGIILVCITVRCGITFLIVKFAGLNCKERLFVALAWIPKATVQAALAPLVVTTVIEKSVTDWRIKLLAKNIVVMAVFGILFTAPLGAILIAFTGPRLLQKGEPEEEFPNGEPEASAESQNFMPSSTSVRSQNPAASTMNFSESPSTTEGGGGQPRTRPPNRTGSEEEADNREIEEEIARVAGGGSKGDTARGGETNPNPTPYSPQ